MTSSATARSSSLQVSYAWVIVAASFLTLLVASSGRMSFGLFFKPLKEDFAWSQTTLSIGVSIAMIVYGLFQPVAGYLSDRYGPKRVILGGTVLAGVGMLLLSQMHALWQLYLYYSVIVAIGTSSAAFVPQSALLTRWFTRRRPLALSIAFAGAPSGQLIMAPLVLYIITSTDWRTAFFVVGLALILGVGPLVLALVRDHPRATAAGTAATSAATHAVPSISLGRALRMRSFWMLAGSYSTCGFSITMIGMHLPTYVDDLGLSQGVAASALSVIGGLSLIGSIASGLLSGRCDRKTVLASAYFMRGTGVLVLVLASGGSQLWLFATLAGISWLATVPLTSALTVASFGQASMGTILGFITLSHQMGDALGVAIGGVLRDLTGSYDLAYTLVAAALFAAAAVSYFIPEPRPVAVEAAPA